MKGFPNQVSDLSKLATGMRCVVQILDGGQNPKDDGIFGEALVRSEVAGTGHRPMPIEEYIREQRAKTLQNQSFRATARGLRELYRLLGFIDDSGPRVVVTDLGRRAAEFAGAPMDAVQVEFWRRSIRNMTHGEGESQSHPYQVLLHLIGRLPGITRANCALALEAENDSVEELNRIVELAALPEAEIRRRIDVTQSNWENGRKVLPTFAEQLGDVVRVGQNYMLAVAPGRADEGAAEPRAEPAGRRGRRAGGIRIPRTAREVTPESIGRAGLAERPDEVDAPAAGRTAEELAETARIRADRLRRHNFIVRDFAGRLEAAGARLYEDPFDVLAVFDAADGILGEVKTLDGTEEDERVQVRLALAQLLYYEPFFADAIAGESPTHLIAVFEGRISDAHAAWLNRHNIGAVWKSGDRFDGDALAKAALGRHLEEMR